MTGVLGTRMMRITGMTWPTCMTGMNNKYDEWMTGITRLTEITGVTRMTSITGITVYY